MKKLIQIFIFLLLIPSVSAISSTLSPVYQPGETMIFELSGNFLEPIKIENIHFLRGHVEVAFDFDFKKIGDKYYFWAIAPAQENNYTFLVKNIVTTFLGRQKILDFEQNFSTKGAIIDYAIKPGVIFTDEDFDILVFLSEDLPKDISLDFPDKGNYTLSPGDNILHFSIEKVTETSFFPISIGKYKIPAYIIKKSEPVTPAIHLKFSPNIISSTILSGKKANYTFSVINEGEQEIKSISFDFNKTNLDISPSAEFSLLPNQTKSFTLLLKNASSNIQEFILAKSANLSIPLFVEINITRNISEVKTNYSNQSNLSPYCDRLGGKLCSFNESCSVEPVNSREGQGLCCIGSCELKKAESRSSILGYLIAAFVLIILAYLGLRYLKTKRKKNIFAQKVSEAEKKLPKPAHSYL